MIVVLGVERTVERIGEENGGEGDGHKDQEVVPFRSHPENAEKTCKNMQKLGETPGSQGTSDIGQWGL